MALEPGQTLAHYRLVEKIGEGGMGVVWKADDTKLARQVAVKILPEAFARDPKRLARFRREARLLASLNHPNIAAIHGLEESDGTHFLALELVPGESLLQRLKRGPLAIDESLDLCRQVAEGLEAAHEAGIIHRDLKPGNIKVTPEGKAKILDFGLAKALAGDVPARDLSQLPTLTDAGTREGSILGTPAYMSPEQARGGQLDRRTDIWSFGCVLYQCLTGHMPFRGRSTPDVVAALLQSDPDWSVLPDRTPSRVRELLERCLEKSPRNRLHDIGDARIELDKSLAAREWTTSGIRASVLPAEQRSSRRRLVLVALAAGILLGTVATLGLWQGFGARGRGGEESTRVTRFSILAPPGRRARFPHISPDGAAVFYWSQAIGAREASRDWSLSVRPLHTFEDRDLSGTGSTGWGSISPDGSWLAFTSPISKGSPKWKLFRIPVDGSTPRVAIADLPETRTLMTVWLDDVDIVGAARDPWRLMRFPTDGRPQPPPVPVSLPDDLTGLDLWSVLSDGRHLLGMGYRAEAHGFLVDVVLIDTETGQVRVLIEDGHFPSWSETGHILFTRRDVLLAAPFDPDRLEVTGAPLPLLSGLRWCFATWEGLFDLSRDGTLVYQPGGHWGKDRHLALLDIDGSVTRWSDDGRVYWGWQPSPDGEQVAIVLINTESRRNEIWISEIDRPRPQPLIAKKGMGCDSPVWSPDAGTLFYSCAGAEGEGGLYAFRLESQGQEELILPRDSEEITLRTISMTPEGSFLLVDRVAGGVRDVLLVPVAPDADGVRQPRVLLPDHSEPSGASVSPDGRYLAYQAADTGRPEVYLRRFHADGSVGRATMVTSFGAFARGWSNSSPEVTPELFFANFEGKVLAISVTTRGSKLEFSDHRLFADWVDLGLAVDTTQLPLVGGASILPDGRWLVVQQGEGETGSIPIHVVLNFHEEIKRKFAEAEGTGR
jgi:serine/threonine protein kinase